jgi:aminopeptidase N
MRQLLIFCFALAVLLLPVQGVSAQGYEERLQTFDILHYGFTIGIQDHADHIVCSALVEAKVLKPARTLELDFVARGEDGKGMVVYGVRYEETEEQQLAFVLEHEHKGESLLIHFPHELKPDTVVRIRISYSGIPADGLIFTNSEEHGKSYFGDNWPNRAHHWLPVVDHPMEKASVRFSVAAPAGHKIIANGRLEDQQVKSDLQVSKWYNEDPLPTKVMVIGVADFAIENVGKVGDIPVSTWVFKKDEVPGFYDYAQGKPILEWFVSQLGEYPWDKLANVQSRTRYGGMENASCIFYAESSVKGDRSCEALMAHEIAHQWFGNSASEASWWHIWLSEGFATYWTHVYFEKVHGWEVAARRLAEDRDAIVHWDPTWKYALVDSSYTDLNQLLNINSYQKGSWVLHMLRREMGDEAFFKGLKEYHRRFMYGNALTRDLQQVLEEVGGQDLDAFFRQWVNRPGHPKLDVEWSWNKKKQLVTLKMAQTQPGEAFLAPMDIGFYYAADSTVDVNGIELTGKSQKTTITANRKPDRVVLDPQVRLLFEGKVREK